MQEQTRILQRLLRTGLIAVATIFIGYAVWEIPRYLQPATEKLPVGSQELINIQNEYRKIFVQIIGGIAILYGLYLNARRTKALEETAKNNEQGQITERFTKAIEQLGSEKLEVRLGAIYALERIARDSEKDHWTVMEVLSAYVRENASIIKIYNRSENERQQKISTDIQAVLTVIGRRKWLEKEVGLIALSHTYLVEADLRHANLERVKLNGCMLQRALFESARLHYTDLRRAELTEAINLTVEQLCQAGRHFDGLILDKNLEKQVKEKCPDLLEKSST